ncbi:MmpS family transport accessory protein [Streptomyces sp. NPDC054956]
MNRSLRTTLSVLAAAGLALGVAGCSEGAKDKAVDQAVNQVDKAVNETYEVTYEVTGTGVDSITFHDGGGTATAPNLATADKPVAPWKKTVTLRGIMPAAVSPVSIDGAADLTCKIVYQGKVIKEATGETATAGGCVAVSPIAGK